MMKRVCAWCDIVMEYPGGDSNQVTHGVCPPCYNNMMTKLGAAARAPKARNGNAIEINS